MLKFSIKNLIENISDSDPIVNVAGNAISMPSIQMRSSVSQLPLAFNVNQIKFDSTSNCSDLTGCSKQQPNGKHVDKLNINKSILNQNTFSRPNYLSTNGNHQNAKKKNSNFKQQPATNESAFHHMSNNQRKLGISKPGNSSNMFIDHKADVSFNPFNKNIHHTDYHSALNNLNETLVFNQQHHHQQQQQQQQISPSVQIQQTFPFLNNSQSLSQLSPANLYQQYHLLLSYVSKMPNLVELNHGPSAAAAALAASQLMTSQHQHQQQQQQQNKMLDWPFQPMHSSASPSSLSTSSTSSSSSCSSSSSSSSSSSVSSSFVPTTSHNQTNNNLYSNQSSHQQQQQLNSFSNETLNNYLLGRLSHQYLAKNQEILMFKNRNKVNDVMLNGSVSDSKLSSFIKNSNNGKNFII